MSSPSLLYSNNSSQQNLPKENNTIAKNKEIREDMSPRDIANVISDHLISFVDKAIEAKKNAAEKKGS